jgi:hypothetical protein
MCRITPNGPAIARRVPGSGRVGNHVHKVAKALGLWLHAKAA